jgi:hypothetical protein
VVRGRQERPSLKGAAAQPYLALHVHFDAVYATTCSRGVDRCYGGGKNRRRPATTGDPSMYVRESVREAGMFGGAHGDEGWCLGPGG